MRRVRERTTGADGVPMFGLALTLVDARDWVTVVQSEKVIRSNGKPPFSIQAAAFLK